MDKLPDQWNDRDYPVLREAARRIDSEPNSVGPSLADISVETKIDISKTMLAAKALESGGLIQVMWLGGGGEASFITGLSAEARRKVGLWPNAETGVERMIAALESLAANAPDEDTRTRARKVLDAIGGVGRDLGVAVAGAVITGQIPT